MTGIGFVGAGAIIKEGFTVRGLTTAASIWVTAAIGILTGIGFYFAAVVGTLLALGTLSLFRWIEARLPTETYANFMVRFSRDAAMPETELLKAVSAHGFSVHNLTYRLAAEGTQFEYRMVLRSMGRESARALSDDLRLNRAVLEYRIAPTSD
jgi:putative Mg2+ transporter-C (MgtC) family protein